MKEAFEHSFSINVATAVGVEKSIILREIRKMGFQNSTSGKDCQYGKRWVKCPSLLLHSKFKYLNQKSISRWLSEMKQQGLIAICQFEKHNKDLTNWILVNEGAYRLLEIGKSLNDIESVILLFKSKAQETINQFTPANSLSFVSFKPHIDVRSSKSGIYVIDKVYVGKARDIRQRINQHIQQSLRGSHCNAGLMEYIKERVDKKIPISVAWLDIESNPDNEMMVIEKMIDLGHSLFNNDRSSILYANNKSQSI